MIFIFNSSVTQLI